METKLYVPVVVNNIRVITYFATNLAITLIRQSVAEALRCAGIEPSIWPGCIIYRLNNVPRISNFVGNEPYSTH
jgi:hypothetical protein